MHTARAGIPSLEVGFVLLDARVRAAARRLSADPGHHGRLP